MNNFFIKILTIIIFLGVGPLFGNSDVLDYNSLKIPERLDQLEWLNNKITLSNFDAAEREKNLKWSGLSYALLINLYRGIEKYPEAFPTYLHLSYKLSHHFQQNDQAKKADILLSQALTLLEKRFPSLSILSPKDACEVLRKFNPSFPSFYAVLLHYKSKTYFYNKSIRDQETNEKWISFLKRALALRIIIDNNLSEYQEPPNSRRGTYCRHTFVFMQNLGEFYLDENNLWAAKEHFENYFQSDDLPFEKNTRCSVSY